MNIMKLNEILKELDWWKDTCYQDVYVLINNKEYKVVDVHPECDPVVDPDNFDLREEENHRIVIEIKKD